MPDVMAELKNLIVSRNADFWRELYPKFTISDNPFVNMPDAYPYSAEAGNLLVEQVNNDGYFETTPLISQDELADLVACIEAVKERGFMPRYAFVYDQFFQIFARLSQALSPLIGTGHYLIPDEFEIFHIEPGDDLAGTEIHRDTLQATDAFRDDGRPTLINIWLALSDVEANNSCIHVLPAYLDPYFKRFGHYRGDEATTVGQALSMENTRALPVKAGTLLGWTPYLLHCGSRSSRFAKNTRISLATYFQSNDVRPYHKFALDMRSPVPFEYRLYLIEKLHNDRKAESDEWQDYQQIWYAAQSEA